MRTVLMGFGGWVLVAVAGQGEIRVRLQDYAAVPQVTLGRARAIASAVLEQAGVTVAWADCSPASTTRDGICRTPVGPMDLQVRILNREMAKRTPASRHCMGFALVSGQFPSIASVFYHRAVELERPDLARRAEILGAILAHEIGHLLIAANSHSNIGILRARWDDQDLRLIAQGRMTFTADQAARMLSLTAERQPIGMTAK